MGARAQVEVKMEANHPSVFLYTHWDSSTLPQTVERALSSKAGRSRWDDPQYLARIIFDCMLEGADDPATGFGIGTFEHTDLDYPPIVVDPVNQRVRTETGEWLTFEEVANEEWI